MTEPSSIASEQIQQLRRQVEQLKTAVAMRQQAEEALHDSEAFFSSMVEHLPQYIFRRDLQGRYTYVCPELTELLQRPGEDLTGKTDFDFFPADVAERFQQEDRQIIETKEDLESIQKDPFPGTVGVYFKSIKSPVFGTGHEVIGVQGIFWDITRELETEKQSEARQQRLKRQNEVLMRLSRSDSSEEGNFLETIFEITEAAATTLETQRVSVWLFNADNTSLECVDLFETTKDQHSSGMRLSAADYPTYFEALSQGRVIDAHEAVSDPRTCEFKKSYLEPLGVTSMLDAPIFLEGRLVGVICHEQIGSPRVIFDDCQTFARSMADFVGLALLTRERRAVEEELRRTKQDLETRVADRTSDLVASNEKLAREIAFRKRAENTIQSEQNVLRRMLQLQDRDRQLVAYDLHDGILQDIIGAQMVIEGVSRRFDSSDEESLSEIRDAGKRICKAIDEGRRMISELRPMIIDEQGIVEAIRYLIENEQTRDRLEITFRHDVQFNRLPPLIEGNIYRIVQEALNNVRRHTTVKHASIGFVQQDELLTLDIRDEGEGFDIDHVPEGRFGLKGITERARLFGGSATINSTPGQGTHIHVELPATSMLVSGQFR